ncbi:MAG: hypothetical protein JWR53_934 [Glaciihabitans sp.]|nr:hypothetical protein [Glaciihabitans sp.]
MNRITMSAPTARKRSATHTSRLRRAAAIATALVFGSALALAAGSSASAAVTFSQCSSVYNTPGLLITCDVDVTNTLDVATGIGSSVVVATECHGPANQPNPTCTTTPSTFQDVVGTVSQCNDSVNGGGANVDCSVTVHNILTGVATAGPATVNQCIGSAGGGGTQPTLVCSPKGSTTSATVTQCNGSANGGGGARRVKCTVLASTRTAQLPVIINQCNNSANGGGSTVVCDAELSNRINGVDIPGSNSGSGGGTGGGGSGGGGGTGGGTGTATGGLAATGVPTSDALLTAMALLLAGSTLLIAGELRRRKRLAHRA